MPEAPSQPGTADVAVRLHTLLGLRTERSGDRVTVTGSARAYRPGPDAYRPWAARPVRLERLTGPGWTTLAALTTDDRGNVVTAVRLPANETLRLATDDDGPWWGAVSAARTA